MVGPAVCREACVHLRTVYGMSERRACRIIGGTERACATARGDRGMAPYGIAFDAWPMSAGAFGYRRLYVLLRREGQVVNRKRVYRLYREERLMVRRRGGRKRALGTRAPIALPSAANERWSLDFVHDQMVDARRFRILAVVDDCTRECLALVADTSIPGLRVARELDRVVARPAGNDRFRQRDRADLQRNATLGRRAPGRLALHRSWQTDAERLHRELQRPSAG
jgi:putative transposase